MVNAVLLAAACAAAVFQPVWGFGILLLLTSTLFNLHQYFTVSLPVGYIEPVEALIASMMLAIFLKGTPVGKVRREQVREILGILAPYCAWQTVCVLVGLVSGGGTEQLRFGLRFLLSGVLPWFSLYVLASLSAADGHKVFKSAYYLALATAVIHLGLQLTDYRPLMRAAYWWVPENGEQDFSWMQLWLDRQEFVRGLPQGLTLILFFALLMVATYIFADARGSKRIRSIVIAAILFTALFITLTRSLMAVFGAGMMILISLAVLTGRWRMGSLLRAGGILMLFAGAAVVYDTIRPGFLDVWSTRIDRLSGSDSEIFSEENAARGKDNLAALAAIRDRPIFGWGTPRYPREYSLRNGPPTDTHPMLGLGVVGGIPAMVLMVLMETRLFLPAFRDLWRRPSAVQMLPFVAILMMNAFALNMIGAGGSLTGPPILVIAIFANEMFNRRAVATGPRFMSLAREKKDYATISPHIHFDAFV